MSRINWSKETDGDDGYDEFKARMSRIIECIDLLFLAEACDQAQVHLADAVLEDLKDLSDEIRDWRSDSQDAVDDEEAAVIERAELKDQGICPVCKGKGKVDAKVLPRLVMSNECPACKGTGKYGDD